VVKGQLSTSGVAFTLEASILCVPEATAGPMSLAAGGLGKFLLTPQGPQFVSPGTATMQASQRCPLKVLRVWGKLT
jgi:hypothetical protein